MAGRVQIRSYGAAIDCNTSDRCSHDVMGQGGWLMTDEFDIRLPQGTGRDLSDNSHVTISLRLIFLV